MKIVNKVEKEFTLEQIRDCMLNDGLSSIVLAIEEKDTTEVYKIDKVYKIEEYLELPKPPAKKVGK